MTVYSISHVHCDYRDCSNEFTTGHNSPYATRMYAHEAGWVLDGVNMDDLCPTHAASAREPRRATEDGLIHLLRPESKVGEA